jgi:prefoldin subunit 5
VKQEVVHLGQHRTADSALKSWPSEIKELKTSRPKQAKKLEDKLERLRELAQKGEQ